MRDILFDLGYLILFMILARETVTSIDDARVNRLRDAIKTNISRSTDVKYSHYSVSNKGIDIKMDAIDKFHLKYIERTDLKQIVKYVNVYMIWLIMAILFITSMLFFIKIVYNIVTATILAVIVASIPLMLLDLRAKSVSEKARREVYSFVSALKAWSNVKSDIVYIFDKASQDAIGPLGNFSRQMVAQIKGGLPAEAALEILRLKVNNQYFDTLILNISQAFTNQGDLTKLLSNLEKEAFRLERAYNTRKIKTLMDRAMVFVLLLVTLSIAVYLLTTNESVRMMFVLKPTGQIVLAIASVVFAVGVLIQFKITEFNH